MCGFLKPNKQQEYICPHFKKLFTPYLMKAKSWAFVKPHWDSSCVFKFHVCPQSVSPPSALRHCLFNLDSHSGRFLPWVCLLLKTQSYEGQAWRKHLISRPSATGAEEGIRSLTLRRRTNSSLCRNRDFCYSLQGKIRICLIFQQNKPTNKHFISKKYRFLIFRCNIAWFFWVCFPYFVFLF